MTLWCEPVASLTQHLVTRFDVMMHVQPLSFKKQLIRAYPNIAWNRRQRVLTELPNGNWYLSLHCPTNAIVDVDSLQRSGKIIVIQDRNVLRRTMLWYNGNIATC